MTRISSDTSAHVLFSLRWQNAGVSHEDRYYAQNVNLWRDYLPAGLGKLLLGLETGQSRRMRLEPGSHLPAHDPARVMTLARSAFNATAMDVSPVVGRFYPQGVLRGLPGVYPQNILPFRVVAMDGNLVVDLNHPLAGMEAELEARAVEVWPKAAEFGGQCQDWLCLLTDGPGLKRDSETGRDFGLSDSLAKPLGGADATFYATPRKVGHVDSQARQIISGLYAELLAGKTRVLDLMAGWQSHLPEGMSATGLGMNEEEMRDNPALNAHVCHDLNADPVLPFADRSFDAAVCSLSVEYLTRPVEVLRDVARCLEPGSPLIVIFSHRWFPDQAVRIWTELHEFERAAMVVDMFRGCGKYRDLHTRSERGWPRPKDARDRYYPVIQHADPVHAVWGWSR